MANPLADQQALAKTDRRQTYRIAVTQPLQVTVQRRPSHAEIAFLTDLSEAGCFLQCQYQFAIGKRLALILELPQPVSATEAHVV